MNPHVTAILLTADRQAFTDRAVKCFLAQTYENKRLLILDSGNGFYPAGHDGNNFGGKSPMQYIRDARCIGQSVGRLRNWANAEASKMHTEVLMHWDSDDWSAPTRMEEQVRFLIDSKADMVGYNEMLFWDTLKCSILVDPSKRGPNGEGCLGTVESIGEAWRYRSTHPHDILGTSLCYWREVWERRLFADTSQGEDERFVRGLNCAAQSSIAYDNLMPGLIPEPRPLMVATIHGGNTSKAYQEVGQHPQHWTREEQFDSRLREICAL